MAFHYKSDFEDQVKNNHAKLGFCLLTAGFPFPKHLLPNLLSLAFMWPTILDALCIWNRSVWPCVPGIVMVVHFYHPDSIMVNFCLETNISMHDGSSEDEPIYSKESSWNREKQSKNKDSRSGNREKGANLEIFRLHVPVKIDDKLAVMSRQWEGKTRTSYFSLPSQCCDGMTVQHTVLHLDEKDCSWRMEIHFHFLGRWRDFKVEIYTRMSFSSGWYHPEI